MIDALFAAQAARTPDTIAVAFEGDRLTYRELAAAVDRLAATLQGRGVGPGALVALFFDRSLELVVAMLGVLKAGGAYVPLDPTHPSARLAYILEDAKPRVLLTRRGGPPTPPAFTGPTIAVDAKEPSVSPAASDALTPPARTINDLAYVIYTSGSTGAPKGVAIEHRSVVNMLQSMLARPGLGAVDILVAITTPMFDISVLEIFLPLICGARVVVASDAVARDGVALAALIESVGATALQATPSGLRMLIDSGWRGAAGLKIFCGGEAWPEQLAAELLERCGSLWNMYGPTETTVWSAVAKIEPGQPVRIGRPIANTALYVLDESRQLLPVGVTGELYIGGAGLARGYFNRDQLTRERFVRDPYAQTPGAKMYRTGDLVRRHADGTLEFFGRTDHQVKIRGHRVELGEIEAELASQPGVQQAVVVARDDAPGGLGLVAYVIAAPEGAPSIDDLRRALREALPAYMMPAAFVTMSAFPLTPNGKVDRKAMPSPVASAAAPTAFVPPRDEVEDVIAQIWGELLGSERVGAHDNFFELGGHSLAAARMIGKINKTFNVKLGVATAFLSPTIELLAGEVGRLSRSGARKAKVMPLQEGRLGPQIFFVGAGGLEYSLAKFIGPDFAIYGVDVPLDSAKSHSVAGLAQPYAEAIWEHAGASPSALIGYSFRGKIAFEAAHALHALGGNVAAVVLIDAFAWRNPHVGMVTDAWEATWRGFSPRRNKRPDGAGGAISAVVRLWRFNSWLARQFVVEARRRASAQKTWNPLDGMIDIGGDAFERGAGMALFRKVRGSFHPRPLDARGVLIRAEAADEKMLPNSMLNGWPRLFDRGLEVIHVAGEHKSIIVDTSIRAQIAGYVAEALRRMSTP